MPTALKSTASAWSRLAKDDGASAWATVVDSLSRWITRGWRPLQPGVIYGSFILCIKLLHLGTFTERKCPPPPSYKHPIIIRATKSHRSSPMMAVAVPNRALTRPTVLNQVSGKILPKNVHNFPRSKAFSLLCADGRGAEVFKECKQFYNFSHRLGRKSIPSILNGHKLLREFT